MQHISGLMRLLWNAAFAPRPHLLPEKLPDLLSFVADSTATGGGGGGRRRFLYRLVGNESKSSSKPG
jgi:hypothetical protein